MNQKTIYMMDDCIEESERGAYQGCNTLVCPICDFEYCHFGDPLLIKSDNYTAWQGRGDLISIPCRCENGHKFEICFGFHKGNTSVFAKSI